MAGHADSLRNHAETKVFPALSASTTPDRDTTVAIAPRSKRAKTATPSNASFSLGKASSSEMERLQQQSDSNVKEMIRKLKESCDGSYSLPEEDHEDELWVDRLTLCQGRPTHGLSHASVYMDLPSVGV
jgi:hypothetical protein